jgi:hypothetical protein
MVQRKKKSIIPVFLNLDWVLISFLFAMNKEGDKEEAERVGGRRERKRERERERHKVKRVKVPEREREREREHGRKKVCVRESKRERN